MASENDLSDEQTRRQALVSGAQDRSNAALRDLQAAMYGTASPDDVEQKRLLALAAYETWLDEMIAWKRFLDDHKADRLG